MRLPYFTLFVILILSACETTRQSTITSKPSFDGTVQINVLFSDTLEKSKDLNLYAWQGIQVEKIDAVPATLSASGMTYQFFIESLDEGMYYVGYSLKDMKSFLLSGESMVSLSGLSTSVKDLTLQSSALNTSFQKISDRIKRINKEQMDLIFEYNQKKGNADALQTIVSSMKVVDSKKKDLMDSLIQSPILHRFMTMNSFQSYQNNRSDGDTEARYFADHFFDHITLSDSGLYKLPMFYESVKQYARSLTQMALTNTQQLTYIDTLLHSVRRSRNELPTITACMLGTMGKNNSIFVKTGNLFLESYKGRYPQLDKFVQEQIDKLRGALAVGFAAPSLKGPNPDGKEIQLADFKGKYVLIDFWASWCGPCRRENPNVVRMYQKYSKKGFEILGVSLDNNKDKWINAIAKDKLTWPHMSDLKGWASSHAKKYGVRGIPFTVLVDPQGRVVATKLRGAQLEKKLSEIFDS